MRTLVVIAGLCAVLCGPVSAQFTTEELDFVKSLESVPATPAELSPYNYAEQKLIFRSLDPAQKSNFWNNKLNLYIESHPDLSKDQVTFIEYVMSVATPEFFSLASGDVRWKPVVEKTIEGLSAAALNLFDADEISAIFVRLGDGPSRCAGIEKSRSNKAVDIQLTCNCLWGAYCGIECSSACSWTSSGCGFLGAQGCTKVCLLV